MQQIINTGQGILDVEFLLQKALGLFGSKRTNTIGLGGLGQKTLLEKFFLRRRQVRRSPRLSLRGDGFEPMVSVRIRPSLYEPSAASQGPCNRWSLVTVESQENGSIPISLLGIAFLVAALMQLRQVVWTVELDVHPTDPPVFSRVCQMLRAGATLF
jgi:hypothetical protein